MTVPLTARILLADDHPVVRRGIRFILDTEPDLSVVAEADTGVEALQETLRDEIDLAILDITMPEMTGIQVAARLATERPETRTLILSMHDDERYLFEALRAGASGYVLKTVADRDIVEACRAALRGEPFLYPGAVTSLIRDHLARGEPVGLVPEPLTPRELEVVKLVAEAYTTDQIAERLSLSPKTVERHRSNVLGKLGMRDRVELVRYAIRRGLIQP